jgi:Ca2+-binding EF-hand superfamily protein
MAKTNDYILIEELGDAFRHAGQNPSEDVVKDMIERAKALKKPTQAGNQDGLSTKHFISNNLRFLFFKEVNDHLTYPDFLTIVHEYWYPIEDDRQTLEEAFDVLDPKRTAKLMVDDFTNLLRNCDWPEDEIDLILSQVSCADGYFIYDGKK